MLLAILKVQIRDQKSGNVHFIKISLYRRKPLLREGAGYGVIESEVDPVRKRYFLYVACDALMHEHSMTSEFIWRGRE